MKPLSTARALAARQPSPAKLPEPLATLAERFERIRVVLVLKLPHGSKQIVAARIPRSEDMTLKAMVERVSREINGEREMHLATVIVSREYLAEVGDSEAVEQIDEQLCAGRIAIPIREGEVFHVFGRGGQLYLRGFKS